MARMTAVSSSLLLGFDDVERELGKAAMTAAGGYPPCNIERIAATDSEPERLRITLAVAEFRRDQIEVALDGDQLLIRGRQREEERTREYLYRGIAARQFQRGFLLAQGMEVLSAGLDRGLLSIDLVRPQPERTVRKIQISARD
jgi:HSP20 family molecular chaperone IbpA